MDNALEFAAHLAQETGQLLKNYFHSSNLQTSLKADRTVVTEADLAADDMIRQAIEAAYPNDRLLTEESDTLVDGIDTPVWVIDPLDGTSNFSLGLPIWGVSIARLVNGFPQIGVLYFPVMDELLTAERGKGAALNGQPLKTRPASEHPPYTFFVCCSRTYKRYNVTLRYKTRILGASSYDYAAVARSSAMLGFQASPKIWDLAAGWLILQEAGAVVETFEGPAPFPLKAGVEYNHYSFSLVMGADRSAADKVRQGIQKRP